MTIKEMAFLIAGLPAELQGQLANAVYSTQAEYLRSGRVLLLGERLLREPASEPLEGGTEHPLGTRELRSLRPG